MLNKKKTYKRPVLLCHGGVERITLGLRGSGNDFASRMMAMMMGV